MIKGYIRCDESLSLLELIDTLLSKINIKFENVHYPTGYSKIGKKEYEYTTLVYNKNKRICLDCSPDQNLPHVYFQLKYALNKRISIVKNIKTNKITVSSKRRLTEIMIKEAQKELCGSS